MQRRKWRAVDLGETTTTGLARTKLKPLAPFAAAAATAVVARRARTLSRDGAIASTIVGGAIVSGAGIHGAATLLAFFTSSSLLGRLPRSPQAMQRRGHERDAVQVCANGSVAAAIAAAMVIRGSHDRVLRAAMGGALAAATADTWATEIGSRASDHPRSILTGQHVRAGESGGVSLAGLLASAAGAASIGAMIGSGSGRRSSSGNPTAAAVMVGGMTGALADSILGASIQEKRSCAKCRVETELFLHECGLPTDHVRGIAGFNNDLVNFAATLVGATTAALIFLTLTRHQSAKR